MIDVVAEVKAGRGRFEWSDVRRELRDGNDTFVLYVPVFRDAMKFDDVPELDWAGHVIDDTKRYDGVRLPATAYQLQQIADLLDAMLLTPILIEELWLQARVKIDAVVNSGKPHYTRVADLGITHVHRLIEKALDEAGGDDGVSIVDSVGKYWCLINGLGADSGKSLYGTDTACNFGWCSSKGSGPGVTMRVRCWQRPGFKHNLEHHDPSQTIRLMSKHARLFHNGLSSQVHLHDIAADPKLARLLHHMPGPLTYLRQLNVPVEHSLGTITLPEVVIEASPPKAGPPKAGEVS